MLREFDDFLAGVKPTIATYAEFMLHATGRIAPSRYKLHSAFRIFNQILPDEAGLPVAACLYYPKSYALDPKTLYEYVAGIEYGGYRALCWCALAGLGYGGPKLRQAKLKDYDPRKRSVLGMKLPVVQGERLNEWYRELVERGFTQEDYLFASITSKPRSSRPISASDLGHALNKRDVETGVLGSEAIRRIKRYGASSNDAIMGVKLKVS